MTLNQQKNENKIKYKKKLLTAGGNAIELFERYKTWAERTKNYILSQARFASCVFKRFHKHTPKSARVPGGKRIWKNLRYVEFKSVNVPDKGWQE